MNREESRTRPPIGPGLGMTPPERTEALISVLQSWAPHQQAYDLCAEMPGEMREAGAMDDDIDLAICHMIIDGLNHGNWPWTAR